MVLDLNESDMIVVFSAGRFPGIPTYMAQNNSYTPYLVLIS